MLIVGVLVGIALIVTAVWVWRLDPTPGSGLSFFPAAHVRGYAKVLAVVLGLLGIGAVAAMIVSQM